jgi:DNA-binding transcriptional ArsR family regulator
MLTPLLTCVRISLQVEGGVDINAHGMTGDELLRALSALSNPHRLRIVGALAGGRNYVSELARVLGMSRPLLHMHLKKLEAAGLVAGSLELSEDGKAMRYFETTDFDIELTPGRISEAARTLSETNEQEGE